MTALSTATVADTMDEEEAGEEKEENDFSDVIGVLESVDSQESISVQDDIEEEPGKATIITLETRTRWRARSNWP